MLCETEFLEKICYISGGYEFPECFNCGKNLWIAKPTNLNRGNGISLIYSYSSVLKFLASTLQIS